MASQTRRTGAHVKSTFSEQPCKAGTALIHGEIEAGRDGKHKQAPSQLLSAHFRDMLGRELGSKGSPQISHWTELAGHSLMARPWAELRDALVKLVLRMTLLSRVHFSPLSSEVK